MTRIVTVVLDPRIGTEADAAAIAASIRAPEPAGAGTRKPMRKAESPVPADTSGAEWREKAKAALSAHAAAKRRGRVKRAAKAAGPGMIRRPPEGGAA